MLLSSPSLCLLRTISWSNIVAQVWSKVVVQMWSLLASIYTFKRCVIKKYNLLWIKSKPYFLLILIFFGMKTKNRFLILDPCCWKGPNQAKHEDGVAVVEIIHIWISYKGEKKKGWSNGVDLDKNVSQTMCKNAPHVGYGMRVGLLQLVLVFVLLNYKPTHTI